MTSRGLGVLRFRRASGPEREGFWTLGNTKYCINSGVWWKWFMMLRVICSSARVACTARAGVSVPASLTSCLRGAKQMPPRPPLMNEDDITEAFLKGSGPGGQKINKTSSAVQLKHLPTGIVIKVQATRSREQNRKIARQMLAEKIEQMEKGPESRVAIVGDAKRKRKSSAVKKSKRKYRLLAAEKGEVTAAADPLACGDLDASASASERQRG